MIIIPAEWSHHRVTWAAWPSHVEQWGENYLPARQEVIPMIKALAKGERVKLLATGDEAVNDARLYFEDDHVDVIHAAFGHIWLHDTGPLFGKDKHGPRALCFKFNGWGGRAVMKYDDEVSGAIARATGLRLKQHDFVLEGSMLDFDGEGRVLAARAGLLDPARNPAISQPAAEAFLKTVFAVTQIIWIDGAIAGDPTGGAVTNLARFIAPGRVVCQTAATSDDPNAALFRQVEETLREAGLEVITVPSPGRVLGLASDTAPASHMNFVFGNNVVIIPAYETTYASEAAALMRNLMPEREILTLRADHLLAGGRAFHAMTRAEPSF